MKPIILLATFLCLILPASVQARDTKLMKSISKAMQSEDFKERLSPDIQFYFGENIPPQALTKIIQVTTNRKTNAFNKTDDQACEWVLLSALLALQQRAIKEGGNAVTNIVSYYKKHTLSSETEYECHAGTIVAGVALKGTIVKIDN